jgi:hypothetical protein
MTGIVEAIKVHIVGSDIALTPPSPTVSKTKTRHQTFRTFVLQIGQPVNILGHIPNRRRATITVVGQSTDVVYLSGSLSEASQMSGAIAMALQVVPIEGNDEVWAVTNTSSFALGVISEFEEE